MDPLSAAGPGVEVVKCACNPIARRLNYLRNLESNLIILSRKNQELMAQESDIRKKLDLAEAQKKTVSNRVSLLLQDVAKIKDQVNAITTSLDQGSRRFFNCFFRVKMAKSVTEVIQEVDRLLGETNQFANELVFDEAPPRALALHAPSLVGKSTVEKNLEKILKSLSDPMIHKIGLYAMGGSGKTSTMKNVNNQLAKTDDFDKIIWVTVSSDFNLDKVQHDIAGQLNLDLSTYAYQENRSHVLSQRLKQTNKFLIILDDVWDLIPLDKVGIPEPDSENGCKILLTTRSLAVCRDMGTQKDIKLELLSEDEAWDLFVGDQVLTAGVHDLAKEVVNECCGLPLAIITVGRAMRGELNIRIWRQALKDLRSSPVEIRRMEDDVFKLLHFSYTRLRNEKVRKCFLHLALFPEDYGLKIHQLIRCWMDESFINEDGDLEAEMDEGYKIMKEIVDACMFEQFSEPSHFVHNSQEIYTKMHDLLRDLAIHIMGEEDRIVVKSGMDLTESPKEKEWNNAKRSLMVNRITVLPDQPNCPNLSTLLLCHNPLSESISCSFFLQMPALRILDLSYTEIKELPSSLSDLLNLRALLLQKCTFLEKIPSIAKLKKLRVLNLSSTNIAALPEGMEELTSLRSLNISNTFFLENLSIPELPFLEELNIEKNKLFEMEQSAVTKCIQEIACLKGLSILAISFLRLDDYLNGIKHIQWQRLKSFCIKLSCYSDEWMSEDVTLLQRSVFVKNEALYYHPSTLLLPPNTQQLHIEYSEIPSLLTLLSNPRSLNTCYLRRCSITPGNSLISGEEVEENTFTNLEFLSLSAVYELAILWKGVIPHDSLSNLRVLEIQHCRSLKYLFVTTLLQNLKNIEVIKIIGGHSLEQMVISSDKEGDKDEHDDAIITIVLPRLHTFVLKLLPELQSISAEPWVCSSLHHIQIEFCWKLMKLPFTASTLSNLEEIQADPKWWKALKWGDPDTRKQADNLESKIMWKQQTCKYVIMQL